MMIWACVDVHLVDNDAKNVDEKRYTETRHKIEPTNQRRPSVSAESLSAVTPTHLTGTSDHFNPFNASCSKLLLFKGLSTIPV